MREIISMILPYAKDLLTGILGLVGVLVAYLTFRVSSKMQNAKIKSLEEMLEQAKSKETYIRCPKCGSKLPLSDITFYLPGELKDNNLNGIDDNLE